MPADTCRVAVYQYRTGKMPMCKTVDHCYEGGSKTVVDRHHSGNNLGTGPVLFQYYNVYWAVTTMLTYPWKCTVLHCNHLGNTWKPLVLMTRHFDYCPSASEGDNQSVRSSAPVVSRCFPGGYNVKLCISRGRLAWWLLAFLHSASTC